MYLLNLMIGLGLMVLIVLVSGVSHYSEYDERETGNSDALKTTETKFFAL